MMTHLRVLVKGMHGSDCISLWPRMQQQWCKWCCSNLKNMVALITEKLWRGLWNNHGEMRQKLATTDLTTQWIWRSIHNRQKNGQCTCNDSWRLRPEVGRCGIRAGPEDPKTWDPRTVWLVLIAQPRGSGCPPHPSDPMSATISPGCLHSSRTSIQTTPKWQP